MLPNATYEVLGIKGIVLIFTHLEPPLQEPYIFLRLFLLQAIFGCKCSHKLNFTLFAVPVYIFVATTKFSPVVSLSTLLL